jgi:dTDP-4-dehydrorhamnose 3,5-epimerase
MRVHATALPEVLLLEPDIYSDDRGFLLQAFNAERFAEAGLPAHFVQENHSRSRRNVVRALHYQLASPQGKLVTAIHGRVFDVAVDIRVGSPTFGKWTSAMLDGEQPRYLWIPPGFAHGFAVLSDTADVLYKCSSPYDANDQHGIRWNDETLGIPWPVSAPVLSSADQQRPTLADAHAYLPRFTP